MGCISAMNKKLELFHACMKIEHPLEMFWGDFFLPSFQLQLHCHWSSPEKSLEPNSDPTRMAMYWDHMKWMRCKKTTWQVAARPNHFSWWTMTMEEALKHSVYNLRCSICLGVSARRHLGIHSNSSRQPLWTQLSTCYHGWKQSFRPVRSVSKWVTCVAW